MRNKIKHLILKHSKKYWSVLFLTLVAFVSAPSLATFQLVAFSLSIVGLVLVGSQFLFDGRDGWGLFPYLDSEALYDEAIQGNKAAATIWCGRLAFIGFIIYLALK